MKRTTFLSLRFHFYNLIFVLQAYWRATHPPERTTTSSIARTLPSQEVSPSGDPERMGPTPPGTNQFLQQLKRTQPVPFNQIPKQLRRLRILDHLTIFLDDQYTPPPVHSPSIYPFVITPNVYFAWIILSLGRV